MSGRPTSTTSAATTAARPSRTCGRGTRRGLNRFDAQDVTGVRVREHVDQAVRARLHFADALTQIRKAAETLLANPVIEDFTVRVERA